MLLFVYLCWLDWICVSSGLFNVDVNIVGLWFEWKVLLFATLLIMTTTFINHPNMAWTNHLKYTSNDCINLKALWKMLILDDSHEKEDAESNNVSMNFTILLYIFVYASFICICISNPCVYIKLIKKWSRLDRWGTCLRAPRHEGIPEIIGIKFPKDFHGAHWLVPNICLRAHRGQKTALKWTAFKVD